MENFTCYSIVAEHTQNKTEPKKGENESNRQQNRIFCIKK